MISVHYHLSTLGSHRTHTRAHTHTHTHRVRIELGRKRGGGPSVWYPFIISITMYFCGNCTRWLFRGLSILRPGHRLWLHFFTFCNLPKYEMTGLTTWVIEYEGKVYMCVFRGGGLCVRETVCVSVCVHVCVMRETEREGMIIVCMREIEIDR